MTLAERFPASEIAVLLHAPRKTPAQLLRNQWRNVRRHGWRWIPYQSAEIVQLAAARLQSPPPPQSADRPGQNFTLEALKRHPRIRIHSVPAINGEQACAWVRDFGADLGVALGAPILKPALFTLPRMGTINLHKGRLPDYRGMPPASGSCMTAPGKSAARSTRSTSAWTPATSCSKAACRSTAIRPWAA